jgi:hypothetical protein
MYLIVRESDNIIVGSAVNKPSELDLKSKNRLVYEISNSDFSVDMIGQKLIDFVEDND